MRNSVQQAIGGYNAALPHSGDFEMWLRAAAVADVGRVNGPCQAFYRVHASSMQRTTYAGHVTDLEGRRAAFASVLLSSTDPIASGPALYAEACRALAVDALDRACADHDYGMATPDGDRAAHGRSRCASIPTPRRCGAGKRSTDGWSPRRCRLRP